MKQITWKSDHHECTRAGPDESAILYNNIKRVHLLKARCDQPPQSKRIARGNEPRSFTITESRLIKTIDNKQNSSLVRVFAGGWEMNGSSVG